MKCVLHWWATITDAVPEFKSWSKVKAQPVGGPLPCWPRRRHSSFLHTIVIIIVLICRKDSHKCIRSILWTGFSGNFAFGLILNRLLRRLTTFSFLSESAMSESGPVRDIDVYDLLEACSRLYKKSLQVSTYCSAFFRVYHSVSISSRNLFLEP